MPTRLPAEFAINMNLEKMMILQQSDLQYVSTTNYFDEDNPCHIYFICKRPRLTINLSKCEIKTDEIKISCLIQEKNQFKEFEYKFKHNLGAKKMDLVSEYPHNTFKLISDEKTLLDAKVSVHMQTIGFQADFLDLEILYIGQSYGVDGARTAPDRLKNHSTLQRIYHDAIENNPDCEIWLALTSFEQVNIMMLDGFSKFSQKELDEGDKKGSLLMNKLYWEGINEQQRINFTESALIKYFQPEYNTVYKNNFPNPAHKTYRECYDLDINAICIEMQTAEIVNCWMYSSVIKKAPWHMKEFLLNSVEDRKSMFDWLPTNNNESEL